MNQTRVAATISRPAASAPERAPRRWTALIFIALAQLMVALDATIVSIALPSAQAALHASDADRQWVITAYTMAFGGLLLLGGRIADRIGRKRTFLIGLLGFALASALGGIAPDFGVLVGARAVQGAFAAFLTPTALSLLDEDIVSPWTATTPSRLTTTLTSKVPTRTLDVSTPLDGTLLVSPRQSGKATVSVALVARGKTVASSGFKGEAGRLISKTICGVRSYALRVTLGGKVTKTTSTTVSLTLSKP